MALTLRAAGFGPGEEIPARHTCEGQDVSPALEWSDPPDGTKSFALIVDDPDAPDPAAPRTTWIHWIVYNLPPTARALPEGVRAEQLPAGAREGLNDWKRVGYGGPCPPIGRHRYFHKLYALDVLLPDKEAVTRAELERRMEGHILGQAEVMGRYQKRGG